jgi:parallel beta-helix repeat protein
MNKALGIGFATVFASFAFMGGTASASTTCSLFASPTGSDAASGTAAAPLQTAQKLVASLSPGQAGCLEAGNYTQDVTFSRAGRAGAPITLSSAPGQAATLTGRLWIRQGADYVSVSNLNLVGVNADDLPSPTINAANATFSHDDVTNDHTAICFAVGSGWGRATNTLIANNRVHDCGVLPAANLDHGIYVADATNTMIRWNEIYNNADRGIQLYPDAQRTTIHHNVIANNGEDLLFSGDDGTASNGANVYDNVITGAVLRHDVESYYPAGNPVGTGNTLHNNCVWGGAKGAIDTSDGGFTSYRNITGDPYFVNAGTHDYHLGATSPCLTLTGDIAAAVDGRPATIALASTKPSSSTAARRRALARAANARRHHSRAGGIRGRAARRYGSAAAPAAVLLAPLPPAATRSVARSQALTSR